MDVTVAISSYGDPKFAIWAERAERSVRGSAPVVKVHIPNGDLQQARNASLALVETEWVCFLDADDELECCFFEEMEKGTADVRAPRVRYCNRGSLGQPAMPKVSGHTHICVSDCLHIGNWLVVGSLVRTNLVREVGGWRDYPVYEDFDLWQRCWLAGATFEGIPNAIYRAHVRTDSRNRGGATPQQKRLTHYNISKTNMPDENWEFLK